MQYVTLTMSHPRPWQLTGGGDRGHAAQPTHHHRTRTLDGPDEPTDAVSLGHTTAFGAGGRAFLLALGLPLRHQASGREGGRLSRHAPSARLRLGGRTRWCRQCPTCTAVVPGLPQGVVRDRQRRPAMARDARVATHGGRRRAWGAGRGPRAPLARSRVRWALGHQRVGTGVPRGARSVPVSRVADATHRRCLTETGSLPTIVRGRGLWPLGARASTRAAACTEASGAS